MTTLDPNFWQEHFDQGTTVYAKDFQRMRVLDMTDRGELWKAIGATFPKYQILPDTNYIAYVKNNLLASIYSVTKSAEIIPTSDKDKDICINLNVALDCLWDTENVGYYQFQAGERAALCNLGITIRVLSVRWLCRRPPGTSTILWIVLSGVLPV